MKPQSRYQPGDKIGGRYQVRQILIERVGVDASYSMFDLDLFKSKAHFRTIDNTEKFLKVT